MQGSWLEILDLFGLAFFMAYAIYAVKRWSYHASLAISFWTIFENFRTWHEAQDQFPLYFIIAVNLVNLVLFAYFLAPAVREVYFNPRVRWWETKPRFRVNLMGIFEFRRRKIVCTVVDVSEGGILADLKDCPTLNFAPGEFVKISFSFLHWNLSFDGKIVHFGKVSPQGCGIQFVHLSEREKELLYRLTHALCLLDFQERDRHTTWIQDLRNWALKLVRTGEGMLPSVPRRARKPAATPANVISIEKKLAEKAQATESEIDSPRSGTDG